MSRSGSAPGRCGGAGCTYRQKSKRCLGSLLPSVALFHPGAFILKPELIPSPAVEARCLQHREAELGANFGASCAGNSDAKSTDRSVSHVHAIFLRSPLMLLNDL